MSECSAIEYADWGIVEEIQLCHNEAKWQGENNNGDQAIVCDEHKAWLKDPKPLSDNNK